MPEIAFADLWESWYQHANQMVNETIDSGVTADFCRAQFQMLDAVVAAHAGCAERLCPTQQALRRVLEELP